MTLQQQQEQGEGHRCNEMTLEEHQQQIEAKHNGGVERSSLPYPFISKLNHHFWLGWQYESR